ncbi:MAG: hypothetical protein A2583_00820 [Bdellovibrionales bacterium RIFOXYD1_FULL_53_11]|nr:MAG: hypothetical protein A2583_00820 [Bdellovibrionales bacterium RIFOXYD1_FULL_53_11]
MKKLLIAVVATGLAIALNTYAGEAPHPVPLGDVTGDGIALKMHDHAFGGSIKDFVVWGFVDEASFSAELIMRREGQLLKIALKRGDDKRVGGEIKSMRAGNETVTKIYMTKIVPKEGKIIYDINGLEAVATVTSEAFQNGHHINPAVSLAYNGQTVSYKMHKGEGCYGFLMYTTMMIAGAYLH